MSQVLDMDIMCPEEKKIILGGIEFDLTIIPWEIGLRIYDLMPALTELEESGKISSEDYNKFMGIATDIFKLTDESITQEWLTRQISYERFVGMLPMLTKAVFATSKKNEVEEDSQESI